MRMLRHTPHICAAAHSSSVIGCIGNVLSDIGDHNVFYSDVHFMKKNGT